MDVLLIYFYLLLLLSIVFIIFISYVIINKIKNYCKKKTNKNNDEYVDVDINIIK